MAEVATPRVPVLRSLVIPQNRSEPMVVQSIIGDPAAALGHLVNGPVHQVRLPHLPATLLINRNQDGAGTQEFNPRATLLEWIAGAPDSLRGARLSGPAVLIGPPSDNRYTSVVGDVVELLLHTDRFRIQVASLRDPARWDTAGSVFADWFDAAAAALMATRLAGSAALTRIVPEPGPALRQRWAAVATGRLSQRGAPPLRPEDIVCHYSIDELASAIDQMSLQPGKAMSLNKLCLVNLGDGVEEWLVLHDGMTFTVMPLRPCIQMGTFADVIRVLMSHSQFLAER